MGKREKAWRALDAIARELNASARTVGVRALDRLVSKLAGRPVDTAPRSIPRVTPQIIDVSFRPVTLPPAAAPVREKHEKHEKHETHEAKKIEHERVPPLPPAAEVEPIAAPQVEPIAVAEPAVEADHPTAPPSFGDTIIEAAPDHETEIFVEPEPLDTDPGIVTSHITARPAVIGQDTIETMVAPQADEPLPSLPPRFGIDRVVLLAGESEFVFAYWETDPKHLAGPARAELRLLTEGGGLVGRAYVDPLQGRQHLKVPLRGKSYYAELVLLDGSPDGRTLSRSREVVVRVPGQP